MNNIEKQIAKNLSVIMRHKGFSKREFASKLGIGEVTLGRYLNLKRKMPLDTIIKACDILEIDFFALISLSKGGPRKLRDCFCFEFEGCVDCPFNDFQDLCNLVDLGGTLSSSIDNLNNILNNFKKGD